MHAAVAALLVLASDANLAASSQEPTPVEGRLAEVIITARHVPEPAWSVPLALTSVSAQEIARAEIRDLSELADAVPGLAYSFARGQGGVPVIRGMAGLSISSNQDNVATLFDGIYIANAYAIDMSLLDLEAVDVLRGPQNALVGRNAFAGAILYRPATPDSEFGAGAAVSTGSDAFRRETGFINVPLSGSVSARVAAMHEAFDGTITNSADPRHNLGGWHKSGVSAHLAWHPDGPMRARLSAYWYENERDATPRFSVGDVPPLLNCGLINGSYQNYCGQFPAPGSVDISPDARGLRSQTTLARLEVARTWPALTLTSLTGFIQTSMNNPPDDWDLSSAGEPLRVALLSAPGIPHREQVANVYFTGIPEDDHEWSEELRLTGGTARMQWLAGLYWSDNSSYDHAGYTADARALAPDEYFLDYPGTRTPLIVPAPLAIGGRNRISAVFGSLSYAITAALFANADLRWSKERISAEDLSVGADANPVSGAWSFFTPRLSLSYRWPGEVQTYVSAAKGARSGGFNDSTIPAEQQFGAESNWTYEVGLKVAGAGRRVQGTLALYWVAWSDMQITGPSQVQGAIEPIVRNVGDATIKGVEVTLEASPSRWADVRLNYSYAHARFDAGTIDLGILAHCTPAICHMVPLPGSQTLVPDVGGNQLPDAPQQAVSASVTLHGPLWRGLGWNLRAGLDAADRQYEDTDNLNWLASHCAASARLSLTSAQWELSLWGRDLTSNLRSDHVAANTSDSGHYRFLVDRSNGASWGATLAYRFR